MSDLELGSIPLDHPDGVDAVLQVLDLTEVGSATVQPSSDDLPPNFMTSSALRVFAGRSERMPHHRVFGGQMLAQALRAGYLTLEDYPDRQVHSLHAYFIRPGDDSLPVHLAVETIRDGRSFSARRIQLLQAGVTLLSMIASFHDDEVGVSHQRSAPVTLAPDQVTPDDTWLDVGRQAASVLASHPIETRHVPGPTGDAQHAQQVWLKAASALPDDPAIHACVLAYASDYTILESVMRPHGVRYTDTDTRILSLDHAMWFHRPARLDQWCLYDQSSSTAQAGRGLATGQIFQDGALCATVTQEGLVRRRR